MTQSTMNNPLVADIESGDPVRWLPRMHKLLDEQCELCVGLDSLSARQTQAVGIGDTDALLRILGQRQTIIDRVAEIGGALEPFRDRKDALLGRLGPAQREGIVQRVGKIAALVESVRARDDADRITLERMRSNVADELANLSRVKGAAAAYAAHGAGAGARFQDRNG
ncbi:MAG TPA: flagellar export chaperone FlgN [Phycisphaerales bacterium]|nr:flagellar export chaperone FlgN [Phycisphaerales bacterium]